MKERKKKTISKTRRRGKSFKTRPKCTMCMNHYNKRQMFSLKKNLRAQKCHMISCTSRRCSIFEIILLSFELLVFFLFGFHFSCFIYVLCVYRTKFFGYEIETMRRYYFQLCQLYTNLNKKWCKTNITFFYTVFCCAESTSHWLLCWIVYPMYTNVLHITHIETYVRLTRLVGCMKGAEKNSTNWEVTNR